MADKMVEMVRQRGKLTPRYLKDSSGAEPIGPMEDRGRGLEAISDEERARAKEEAFQAKQRRAADTAPTTKTEMGRTFARGGYVKSADGIAKRGKTRGKMV